MDETSSAAGHLTGLFGAGVRAWADAHAVLAFVLTVVALALMATMTFVVMRWVIDGLVRRAPGLRKSGWSEPLLERRVGARVAFLVALAAIGEWLRYVPGLPDFLTEFVYRVAGIVVAIAVARTLAAFMNAVGDRHAARQQPGRRPIKGYVQVVALIGYLLAGIVTIGLVLDRDPLVLLTGIGAASAVLLLIFQNTILSFVAGIQLTTDDLIRVGDWIEMPEMNADGDVKDIALNTVTVQNWDKTLTIIPAHNFLGKSFKNWRGMQASSGRRIKRSLDLDLSSVRFLTDDELEHLSRFALLRPYLEEKRAEIAEWTARNPAAREDVLNSRRLTNAGTFRAYVTRYLRAHPQIAQDMTFLVRQLQPGPTGLPLEVYVFVNDVRWVVYESVQSDIFEHLIAILPEFGLRLFQEPSGSDMRALGEGAGGARDARA